ncbi:hypothetical protein GGE32_001596 [Rhizobium leguminosarum]|nr:hypothetical protein [Rhizobium leguminosarum]MBB4353025.1 hypothetical protein [Rhizobium leguminosarum]MBB4547956.1 hypothetical protein [Rhizobium leguminosarum]MBB4561364.1 hypothetical protein [Rhizobium leguminosarum]
MDTDDRFDQELLVCRSPIELLFDEFAQRRSNHDSDQEVDRDRRNDNQGQAPGIGEKNRDEDKSENDVERRKQPLPSQKCADRFKFSNAGDRLAGGSRLEILQRQPQEMMEQSLAELDIDPVRRVSQRIGPQILKHDIEETNDRDAGNKHEQGRIGFVRQDLVDHDLEEQRCNEREDLHKQRGKQYMGKRLSITPDRWQKPLEAEFSRVGPFASYAPPHKNNACVDFG